MKHCRKCGIDKDFSEFGIDRQKDLGLNSYCKKCIRKRSLDQRKNDPRGVRKYAENYRKKHRELLREKSRIMYYVNWDKKAKQAQKSYYKHKERIAKKRALKNRLREQREKNRLRQAAWRSKNKSRVAEIVAKWKKENPQKSAAHSLVLYAVRSGILKRKECCEECGITCKTEAHHEDYSNPLHVQWICKLCHSNKHQIYR